MATEIYYSSHLCSYYCHNNQKSTVWLAQQNNSIKTYMQKISYHKVAEIIECKQQNMQVMQ